MSDNPFISDDKTRIVHPADQAKPESEQRFMTVRAKMDYGTRAKLNNLAVKTEREQGACSIDQYQLILLEVNVLGWGGPGYAGVALMPANVHRLKPNDPLVVSVVEALTEANAAEESPDPKSPDASTSSADGETSLQES